MLLTADDIAVVTGGRRVGPPGTADGVTIDSRSVRPGNLFVPIVAARDGHDFIADAHAKGAAVYVTAHEYQGGTGVVVPDTSDALLALGRHARGRVDGAVIGITGSVGKTSVKDLTAAAVSTHFRAAASPRSFNNELGVPLTLLNVPDDVQVAVVEMGARGPGHIRLLCDVAFPTVGVVTAVARAHTEFFGTIDDVALGKRELVEALPDGGVAVLNADDARVAAMSRWTRARVLRFGSDVTADVRAGHVTLDDELRATFVFQSPWGEEEVGLHVHGAHQVANALAAGAAALAVGTPLAAVAAGLGTATLSPWRMALQKSPSGARIVNDAYNANPTSMVAALRALAGLPAERRTAVLGVMAELGDDSEAEHRAVTSVATSLGIRVIAVGTSMYGPAPVADLDAAVAALGALDEHDAVLVKGSRVAGLERLAARLVDQPE